MIATSHPLATSAGLGVLAEGGNAADAAICACAVQCVTDSHMTGIGGDCFVLYAPAGGEVRALNGSGVAPAAATPDALRERGITELAQTSPHSVTIPGAISAWCLLHDEYGTLPLDRLFAPAIRYAEEGFPITARVARDWAMSCDTLKPGDHAARLFLPGGHAPRAGAIMRQPLLAARLREIAAKGAAGFYTGETAAKMSRYLRELGGLHREQDFHDSMSIARWEKPISASYRGHEVLECGPNGQGLAALLILRILEGFEMGAQVPQADRIHLLAEATKLAYHHRDALIADPAHCEGIAQQLLSDQVVDGLRSRIDPSRATEPVLWTEAEHKDTIYLCVVDAEGNAISFINSIFHAFGSTLLDPETGVLFHSRGSSFRLDPSHPNAIGPGKRPMHTIIPGMLRENGRVTMPFGVMGGHYQAAGHASFLSAVLDRGLDIQAAMEEPRTFAFDGELQFEPGLPDDVRRDLESRGHRLVRAPGPIGGAQAIRIDGETGALIGASDSRKDGMAAGY
ncbi:gamma-glutamyltransferase family protein [Paracoccus methylarcula]|uniref:Gamma-glutamyltransferase family protein n=2 Tax=Paracoccus methylarcula TaxID=72022 RepID=A0A422QXU3_9RHOB|nr:gamma-glutamyltransferase family protein [Paracoccus methylarcula]RNF34795.1 gamma-glutamyltransferase family protein [Paracoccus methylarcula]